MTRALRHPARRPSRRARDRPRRGGRRARRARVAQPGARAPRPPRASAADAGGRALIVLGLMLGTTIIAAALTTGDTMSHTIRATAVDRARQHRRGDHRPRRHRRHQRRARAATGVGDDPRGRRRPASSGRCGHRADRRRPPDRRRERRSPGPGPATERAERQPVRRRPGADGRLLADPPPRRDGDLAGHARAGEVFLNHEAADDLGVGAGDRVLMYAGAPPRHARRARRRHLPRRRHRRRGAADAPSGCPATSSASRVASTRSRSRTVAARSPGATALEPRRRRRRAGRRAARARDRHRQAGRSRHRRRDGRDVHGVLHDLRHVLDRRRHPARLPDLRHARRRAARPSSASLAPIGTRRGHLVQMFVFEGLAYDLAAAVVGHLPRRGGRLRDGAADGARPSAPPTQDAGLQVEYAVSPAQPRGRIPHRPHPHACRRRRLGLAGEPDDDRDRDPQPARSRP